MWHVYRGWLRHHWKESNVSVRDDLEIWHKPGVLNARVGKDSKRNSSICKHYSLVFWFFRHHFVLKPTCMIFVQLKTCHSFLTFFIGILFYVTHNNCSLFPFRPPLLPYLKPSGVSYQEALESETCQYVRSFSCSANPPPLEHSSYEILISL